MPHAGLCVESFGTNLSGDSSDHNTPVMCFTEDMQQD